MGILLYTYVRVATPAWKYTLASIQTVPRADVA